MCCHIKLSVSLSVLLPFPSPPRHSVCIFYFSYHKIYTHAIAFCLPLERYQSFVRSWVNVADSTLPSSSSLFKDIFSPNKQKHTNTMRRNDNYGDGDDDDADDIADALLCNFRVRHCLFMPSKNMDIYANSVSILATKMEKMRWNDAIWMEHTLTYTHPANVRLAMAAAVAADTMFWDLTATSCSDVLTHTENRQLRRSRHHTHTHTRRTIKWKIVWFEKMKKREEKPSSWLWWCDVFIMRTECFVLGNGETTNRRERILNYTHRSCV